jgi:hypothetical protein
MSVATDETDWTREARVAEGLEFAKTKKGRLDFLGSFGTNLNRELQQLLGLSAVAKNLRYLFESFGARPTIQTSIDESSKLRRRPVTAPE